MSIIFRRGLSGARVLLQDAPVQPAQSAKVASAQSTSTTPDPASTSTTAAAAGSPPSKESLEKKYTPRPKQLPSIFANKTPLEKRVPVNPSHGLYAFFERRPADTTRGEVSDGTGDGKQMSSTLPTWTESQSLSSRAWRASELRLKSFEDLHTLWFVLLKERNLLSTQLEEARRLGVDIQQSTRVNERRWRVRKAMSRIKYVLIMSQPLKLDVVDDELRLQNKGKQLATAAVDAMNDVQAIEKAKRTQDLVELKLTMKMTEGAVSLGQFKGFLKLLSAASLSRIEHERHLSDLCAYPPCTNPPQTPHGKPSQMRIDRSSLSVYTQNTSSAFCSRDCEQRETWARTRCVGKVESDTSLLVDREGSQKLLEEYTNESATADDVVGDIVEHPPSSYTTTNHIVTAACILTLLIRPSFSSVWGIAGAGGASVVAKTLKLFINDPRPSSTRHPIRDQNINDKISSKIDGTRNDGMPSTHSTVAGWLFINLLLSDVKALLKIPGLLYLAAIPLSRTRLGKHTRPQIWCGGALGVSLALGGLCVKDVAFSVVQAVLADYAPSLIVYLS